jgi:hypothetical protein
MGGHSIAVYQPASRKQKAKATKLLKDKRADFISPANYSTGNRLDKLVRSIIDKIAASHSVGMMKR